MAQRSTRSKIAKIAFVAVVLFAIPLVALRVDSLLDLRYVSSRVGSRMDWNESYTAYLSHFHEGMSREEVHAQLLRMDPTLDGRLPIEIECRFIRGQMECPELISSFDDRYEIGSSLFTHVFFYTEDLKLKRIIPSS